MHPRLRHTLSASRAYLRAIITGPQILIYLPGVVIVGFWFGGAELILGMAMGVPICAIGLGILNSGRNRRICVKGHVPDRPDHGALNDRLDTVLTQARRTSRKMACMLVALDDFEAISERHGRSVAEKVARHMKKRLAVALRTNDMVYRFGECSFGIVIGPVPQLNLESGLHLAHRIQAAVEDPIVLDGTTIYVSASVGFSLDTHIGHGTGAELADAAHLALTEARRHRPSAIRAYSPNLKGLSSCPHIMGDGLQKALENGQIRPWFQPQVSTDTGQITGFEALARWAHPEFGILAPAEFIPALEQAGGIERLGEVMLFQSLNALKSWDAQGLDVPHVGVNFTSEELRNPKLPEKIGWELDRFDMAPCRLAIEVLETVVASTPDDMISRNINRLSEMGCQIDLDDFGTGHASISLIRRFAIQRIKIDRTFVMKVDCDPEQQRMVSAILLMAEKLGLDTLAEGVETAGEHAMLAQLGCGHVQGFGIGRPMPFDKTANWISHHLLKLDDLPVISRMGN
jgi:diguanylate cyclase (GGDEF)-like protein